MLGLLESIGIISIIFIIIFILLIPLLATIIVGIGIANILGFTGIYWWACVVLFFLIISSLFTALGV